MFCVLYNLCIFRENPIKMTFHASLEKCTTILEFYLSFLSLFEQNMQLQFSMLSPLFTNGTSELVVRGNTECFKSIFGHVQSLWTCSSLVVSCKYMSGWGCSVLLLKVQRFSSLLLSYLSPKQTWALLIWWLSAGNLSKYAAKINPVCVAHSS